MIKDVYPCYASEDKMLFVFRSEGIQGTVIKMIIFSPTNIKNEWNLAFGDFKDNEIDHLVITNNQDTMKVVRTVAKATLTFFETYPNSSVVIEPIDEKRKRLYNYVFQKNAEDINLYFNVLGILGTEREPYLPTKIYETFSITLK